MLSPRTDWPRAWAFGFILFAICNTTYTHTHTHTHEAFLEKISMAMSS